jgi:hypothetical protein
MHRMKLISVHFCSPFAALLHDLERSNKILSYQVGKHELGSKFEYGGDARWDILETVCVIILALDVLLAVIRVVLR